jgi:hypothetical protein
MALVAKSRHGGQADRPPVLPNALIEGHRGRVSHDANEPAIACLRSGVPARRRAAAELLGEERKMTSFAHLVRALQRENFEEVQISILTALRNIGGATHPEPERMELALGYGPILQFMIDNISKPNLIEPALEAFGYTGTIDAAITGIKLIRSIAEHNGYEASARLASRFYMELENPH